MTSSNTHLKLIECFSSTKLPRTNFIPFTSKPSCPIFSLRHSYLSSFSISLKSNISPLKVVPFVAQVPGSAQQESEEAKSGIGYRRDEVIENLESYDGSLEAKLFVGNFPYDIDSKKLADFFNQAGIVEASEVIYNRQTNQSRGYGFVTMSTVEQADKAVKMFNQYDINGRLLTVNKAAPKGSRPERITNVYEPSFRMYVGNFPWEVDNARLEELFSEYGKVIDARIVYDRESGRSRGFGFVTMSTETELYNAKAALDGQILDGRAIRVTIAVEKPRRSSF